MGSAKKQPYGIMVVLILLLLAILCGCGANGESTEEKNRIEDDQNYIWYVVVDDTIECVDEGVKIEHRLILLSEKNEGKDIFGVYKGAAEITTKMDYSDFLKGNEVFQMLLGEVEFGGESSDHTFEVEGYNANQYTDHAMPQGVLPIVKLVSGDAMALGEFNLKGSGTLSIDLVSKVDESRVEYGDQATEKYDLPYKIYITGERVEVYVPSLKITGSKDFFEGSIFKILAEETDGITIPSLTK